MLKSAMPMAHARLRLVASVLAVASAPEPPAQCLGSCKTSCVMPRCGDAPGSLRRCCLYHGVPERQDVLFPFEAQDGAVYALVSTPLDAATSETLLEARRPQGIVHPA